MPTRADGDAHIGAVILDQHLINEICATGPAGGVDGHIAAWAGVKSHAETLASLIHYPGISSVRICPMRAHHWEADA